MKPFRISGKNLGGAALEQFCPRCSYLKLHSRQKLPYQIFPGIFSSIDGLTKRMVHAYFDQHKASPPWLGDLGELTGYVEPPHHSRFNAAVSKYNILLTGITDGIFLKPDGSKVIVDYKTAKYTGHQDALFPMYEIQLIAYAYIAEQCGFGPVSGLALIYFEPVTDGAAIQKRNYRQDGFAMGFTSHVLSIDVDLDKLNPILARTRKLYDLPSPPPSRPGCNDCTLLENLIGLTER